jgi:hypothetical protein
VSPEPRIELLYSVHSTVKKPQEFKIAVAAIGAEIVVVVVAAVGA